MSGDRKLPVRTTPGALPSLGIPSSTPGLPSALLQHVRNRVADVMYGRLVSVSEKRVALEENASKLVGLATERERLLGQWDDLDNILTHDQSVRDNERANARNGHAGDATRRSTDAVQRRDAVTLAEIEAENRIAVARANQRRLQEQLNPSTSPPQNQDQDTMSPAMRRALQVKKMYAEIAQIKHILETDNTIVEPSELAAAIAEAEAQIRMYYQQNHGMTASSASDDASFNKA